MATTNQQKPGYPYFLTGSQPLLLSESINKKLLSHLADFVAVHDLAVHNYSVDTGTLYFTSCFVVFQIVLRGGRNFQQWELKILLGTRAGGFIEWWQSEEESF